MSKCEYSGCNNEQMPGQEGSRLALCAEHDAELTRLIQAEPFSPKNVLDFWAKATGATDFQQFVDAFIRNAIDEMDKKE